MTKRVIAYVSVSTEGQVKDGYGLEAQERDIRVYCAKNDMELMKVYREEGVSGAKEDRPVFNKILYGEAQNPPVEGIVVAKNDRVARDINIYYYYKMLLKKMDIELISVAEDFGEFGVMARFLEAFTMCVAEMERDNIKKRTSAGRSMKIGRGGFAGGRVPYGYDNVEKELRVNEEEAKVVREIFELRGKGWKLREIAELMNLRGIKSKSGKEFTIVTVQNVLKNEFIYKGKLKYDKSVYEGVHEAIL